MKAYCVSHKRNRIVMATKNNSLLLHVPVVKWNAAQSAFVKIKNICSKNKDLNSDIKLIEDIFSAKYSENATTSNDKSAEQKLNEITTHQLDSLMDEIDDESKTKTKTNIDSNKSDTSINLTEREKSFFQKTFSNNTNNGDKKHNYGLYKKIWDLFTQKSSVSGWLYSDGSLSLSDISLDKLLEENKADGSHSEQLERFKHFGSIHSRLIQTKLIDTLKKFDVTQDDIDYLFKHFVIFKNVCASLPIKCENRQLQRSKEYRKLIFDCGEQSKNINSSKTLEYYCIIHNGIANMLLKFGHGRDKYGFDGIFSMLGQEEIAKEIERQQSQEIERLQSQEHPQNENKSKEKEKDKVKEKAKEKGKDTEKEKQEKKEDSKDSKSSKDKTVVTLKPKSKAETASNKSSGAKREGYGLTNLLSSYLLDQFAQTAIFGTFFEPDPDAHFNVRVSENEMEKQAENKKNAIKLVKKSLFGDEQGLKQFKKLVEYCLQDIDVSKIYQSHRKNGLVFYVINRLTFVIFHDLMNMKDSNKEKEIMFPKMETLFKFLHNFCIYVHCCPSSLDQSKNSQKFHIEQFLSLKKSLYKFEDETLKYAILEKFNYFDEINDTSGTILHHATYCNWFYYCQVLMKHGFGEANVCNVYNRFGSKQKSTPVDIAKRFKRFGILSLFGNTDSNNDDQNTPTSNNNNVNDKSIELRYNSFMNQLSFAKYYLMALGCKIKDETIKNELEHVLVDAGESQAGGKCDPHFGDYLYHRCSNFKGLFGKDKNGFKSGEELVVGVIQLLEKKMPLSEDMLILCHEYCKHNTNGLGARFLNALIAVTQECLQSRYGWILFGLVKLTTLVFDPFFIVFFFVLFRFVLTRF